MGTMILPLVSSCIDTQKQNRRLLPLQGAYNVRDLGGYKTADNKTVKWNKIFRSGDLNQLTDDDLNYLAKIPIITFIDFRDSAEISRAPDRLPKSLKNQIFLPIETGSMVAYQEITAEKIPSLLLKGNEILVKNNQEVYKKFFALLMNEQNTPLLFHCSAGKDRAGFAAALFLSSLGVDRETIIQDYLLTNEFLRDKYKVMLEKHPEMEPLLAAKEEYIQAAFDLIDKEYGGMENYLTRNLGVDLNKMKIIYTE